MTQYETLPVSILQELPPADEEKIHQIYLKEVEEFSRKIVVLDDDPTGVQTVHDVSVYTDWSEESLLAGMKEDSRMFFVLTNSRSFTEEETEWEHRIIADRIVKAAAKCNQKFLVISRGDSTLRGHYPAELEALRDVLQGSTGKEVDGQILCPYFREGGRFTINSVHYVQDGQMLIPTSQTEFAKDKTFGYISSHLGEYVEEKSKGRYKKEQGIYITLTMLREQRFEEITQMLLRAQNFTPIIVDAVCESDVEAFAVCLFRAIKQGKNFLLRTAAAVPKVLGNISTQPLLSRKELLEGGNQSCGGIVMVGSHVKKTTMQLENLKKANLPLEFLEFDVNECLTPDGALHETNRVIKAAEKTIQTGKTVVVYTSRILLAPDTMSKEEMLKLSVSISASLTDVVGGLHQKPRFIIAKGGITSSDVGTRALKVKKATVMGQVQPGIPVWKTGEESRFPGISYIIFPGNVGNADTLKKIVEQLI